MRRGPYAELSDAGLAALVRAEDGAAFEALVRRHAGGVRALLRRMGAQDALADDLAQEAMIVAFQRIGAYRGEGSFAGWLKRIAARLYVRRWRAEQRYELSAEPPDSEIGPDEGASDRRLDLDEALKALSPAERVCVSLCSGAGFSHAEAAALLHAPQGTVKSHVKRGLDKLRRRLAPEGEDVGARRGGDA